MKFTFVFLIICVASNIYSAPVPIDPDSAGTPPSCKFVFLYAYSRDEEHVYEAGTCDLTKKSVTKENTIAYSYKFKRIVIPFVLKQKGDTGTFYGTWRHPRDAAVTATLFLTLNDPAFEDTLDGDFIQLLKDYKWPASYIALATTFLAAFLKTRRNKRPLEDANVENSLPKKGREYEKVAIEEFLCTRDTEDDSNVSQINLKLTSAAGAILNGCGLNVYGYIQLLKRFRILSGKPISELFGETTIWAGSSSGGLLIILLLIGVPIEKIEEMFELHIFELFKKGPTTQEKFIDKLATCIKGFYKNFETAKMGQFAQGKKIILGVFDSHCLKSSCVTNYKAEHKNLLMKDVILQITAIPIVFFEKLDPKHKLVDAFFIGNSNPSTIVLKELRKLNIELRSLLHMNVVEHPVTLIRIPPKNEKNTISMLMRLITLIEGEREDDIKDLLQYHFPFCSTYHFAIKMGLLTPGFNDAAKQHLKDDTSEFLDQNSSEIKEFLTGYFNT